MWETKLVKCPKKKSLELHFNFIRLLAFLRLKWSLMFFLLLLLISFMNWIAKLCQLPIVLIHSLCVCVIFSVWFSVCFVRFSHRLPERVKILLYKLFVYLSLKWYKIHFIFDSISFRILMWYHIQSPLLHASDNLTRFGVS